MRSIYTYLPQGRPRAISEPLRNVIKCSKRRGRRSYNILLLYSFNAIETFEYEYAPNLNKISFIHSNLIKPEFEPDQLGCSRHDYTQY